MTKISANSMIFIKRRSLMRAICAMGLYGGFAPIAHALSAEQATDLVQRIADNIFAELRQRNPKNIKMQNLERILIKYADIPRIAKQALGAPWRNASTAQKKAYIGAFSGYITRYYINRFENFVETTIDIGKTRTVNGGQLVDSVINTQGQPPYNLQWLVIEGRGGVRMLNIYMEGVSVLSDVRIQIQGMLDKNRGDLDKFITYLQNAG